MIFLIRERDSKIENDEPFFLTIQIQGNYYTHGISGKNIVKKGKEGNEIGDFFKNRKLDEKTWKSNLNFFFDFSQKHNKIAGLDIKENGTFYKYGSNFIYQCAEIPDDLKIDVLLNKILDDVSAIEREKGKLKWPK